MTKSPIRVGILGAARIAPRALILPARRIDGVEVVAVASRDRAKAEKYAKRRRIPKVHATYDELIADPEIDAIYNPLPNGLHGRWTLAALDAGKHVLCEKPFAANADEARKVAEAASTTGRVVMEAFHYRYHPLAQRLVDIVRSGELGTIEHIETSMCIPFLNPKDIRFDLALAGGAVMDVGCYTVHLLRSLAGAEPDVTKAEARLSSPGVDRWMRADFALPGGATGRITCALLSSTLLRVGARVVGQHGEVRVVNPWAPQAYSRTIVRTGRERRRERTSRTPTYTYQLRAFVDAVANGTPPLLDLDDAVANMAVIDAIYRAAGLQPRQPTLPV